MMGFPLTPPEHHAIEARIMGQEELIILAAVRTCDGVIVTSERPGRHGTGIGFLHANGYPHEDHGFLTNRGRFVDRLEAVQIVLASGQGSPREGMKHLFSEDLWNEGPPNDRR